jgi:hypothetical protein
VLCKSFDDLQYFCQLLWLVKYGKSQSFSSTNAL